MTIDFEKRKQDKIAENDPLILHVQKALGDERETTMRQLTDKLNLDDPSRIEMVRLSRCLRLMGWKRYEVRGAASRFIWRRGN